MAKNQPDELEPLEVETVYYIKQYKDFPFRDQWLICTNTKYGEKIFQNYYSKEDAVNAANFYKLALQTD